MKKKPAHRICRYCGDDADKPNPSYQLAAGTLLKERYFIGRAIGQGGFGITYIGWDIKDNILVAVKEYFLFGTAMRDAEISSEIKFTDSEASAHFTAERERFLREYKVLSELSEIPGLVQVLDYFSANNTAYIVMEYVEGITLKQYVEKQGGRLSSREVFKILEPIINPLKKIHDAGLVHRDISPDNLMILEDGSVKLLDFGTVREVHNHAADKGLTMPTETIVKRGYAPLEQYQSLGSLGPWTDVYALCGTACYCLTGSAPPEAIERLMQDKPVLLRDAGADISEYEESVLQKGMALRTQDRIPDMESLYDALFHFRHDEGLLREDASCNSRRTPLLKKHLWIPVLTIIIILFCTIAAFYRHNLQLIGNKVIAVPIYFEESSDDEKNRKDYGTWFNINCKTVSKFSDAYTFSCSIYLPKQAFEAESSKLLIEFWLDMDAEDYHIGTTDTIYSLELLHEKDEIFVALSDTEGEIQTLPEIADYCNLHDMGSYYKIEIKNIPYQPEMHTEDSIVKPIDTGRGGTVSLNIKLHANGQKISSFAYLDDLTIRDAGKILHYFDCSIESLYGYSYFYEDERLNGEVKQEDNPEIEIIYLEE